jgi:multidrug resistance efflux pump
MEPTQPSSSPARRWRISLPVWLGVVLLLASVGGASLSLRTHAGDGSAPVPSASSPADNQPWMALGHVDVEGGVTPLYPQRMGQVKSIEAHENEPVSADAPLFHLENSLETMQVQRAENAVAVAKQAQTLAEQKVKAYRKQIDAQKEAVEVARYDMKLARIQRDQVTKLWKKDQANESDRQAAETTWQKAQAGVQAQESKLAALEADSPDGNIEMARLNVKDKELLLNEARLALDKTIVRAPAAGTPLRVLVSVGETLGSNPRQPAIQFCPQRPLLIRAEVEQEFAPRIHKDEAAIILDHATGQEVGRGKVSIISHWYTHRRSILQDPLQFNDVRTLECIISLDSNTQGLRIGQRVRVQFAETER